MIFTPRIDAAIKLASHLHRNQKRRDALSTPYISHLFAVAVLLSGVTDDEDTIVAGLLHDSLEDVPNYSYEKLTEDCGKQVATIVKHVTEPLDANKKEDEQMPWLTRKEIYLKNLREGGKESALVSGADKIHNTESFLNDAIKEGESFLERFGSSVRNKVWFNEQVILILKEKLGEEHIFVGKLTQLTFQLEKIGE